MSVPDPNYPANEMDEEYVEEFPDQASVLEQDSEVSQPVIPQPTASNVPSVVVYEPPPGYVLVDRELYRILLEAYKTPEKPEPVPQKPKETPKPVFKFRVLRQYYVGDINYNFAVGEEGEYCPGEYVKVGGKKEEKIKSFANLWNLQFGITHNPKDRQQALARPIFQILNPQNCPPLKPQNLSRTPSQPTDSERILWEEQKGDASHRPMRIAGETPDNNMGITYPPQPNINQVNDYYSGEHRVIQKGAHGPNDLPPRGGPRGPDGLTQRARMIKAMQGDQVERPAGSYEESSSRRAEPTSPEDFPVSSEVISGGEPIGKIPGVPDEAREYSSRMRRERGG